MLLQEVAKHCKALNAIAFVNLYDKSWSTLAWVVAIYLAIATVQSKWNACKHVGDTCVTKRRSPHNVYRLLASTYL